MICSLGSPITVMTGVTEPKTAIKNETNPTANRNDQSYQSDHTMNRQERSYDPRRPSEGYGRQDQPGERTIIVQVQPSDAAIYVDGNYYGMDQDGQAEITLPDGLHKIEVVRPGYENFAKDIQVGSNFTSSIRVLLQKK